MSFKSLRKAASSFLSSRKLATTQSGSGDNTVSLPHPSTETIQLAAIQLRRSSSLDTVRPVIPTIYVEDVDNDDVSEAEYLEREARIFGVWLGPVKHETDEERAERLRQREEEYAERLRERERMYPPPELGDDERVIETKPGFIRTSKRRLSLWSRGWVNEDTWLEDELAKARADREYRVMGCGI